MTNMDLPSSTRAAQSSIRSFFQPLLQPQQQEQKPQSQPVQPLQDAQQSSLGRATQIPHQTSLPSPPPPVRSYALPPSSRSASQQLSETSSPSPLPITMSALPPAAAVLPVEKDHITPLKRINALLLPITYPDSFYHAILAPSAPASINLSRIITWEDKVVGGVVCRLDNFLGSPPQANIPGAPDQDYHVYIQSLCLLSPYRSKGLITAALDQIAAAAIEETGKGVRIKGLYAHVWTENEEALEWYKKRGFTIFENGVVNGYYRRLKPDTAYILHRPLRPSDHFAASTLPPQLLKQQTEEFQVEQSDELISGPSTPNIPAPPNNTPFSASLAPSPTPTPLPLLRPELRTASSNPPPPPNNTPASNSQVPSPTSTPLPLSNPKIRPPPAPHARSFQDRGPDREWNDLPEDVLSGGSLTVPGSSNASSRSSSRSGLGDAGGTVGRGGKKKRVYPAAAFGS